MRFRMSFGTLAVALMVCALGGAGAQGILQPRPEVREWPFVIKSVRVNSTITDTLAETTVEQTFENTSGADQEGTYLFPLPVGASVSSFSLRAGDRVIEGRLLTKEEARSIYEAIVRRRQDPALLEYVGSGVFRSSVFPIPARGSRTLTLRYSEVLKPRGGVVPYVYPLSTGRFSPRAAAVSSVTLKLRTSTPLKTVYSPSHDVSVNRIDERTATASWEARGEYPERDFTLYHSSSASDVGLSLITHQMGDRDGYFVLNAAPRISVPKDKVQPRQIVFVLDRTGSMQADGKMVQAKAALQHCVAALNPADRFNVITFNDSTDSLTRGLVAASPENLKKAHRFVDDVTAVGGTNINDALRDALDLLRKEGGTRHMVVFLTDGMPTVGETNPERILENVRRLNGSRPVAGVQSDLSEAAGARARVFCFGVGYDVNVPLLDKLAEQTKADADYVRPQESVEAIVSAFFAKVSAPILGRLALDIDGVKAYDVYPKELPDLFGGAQLVVTGRYRGNGPGTVRLTGVSSGKPLTFTLPKAFDDDGARSSLVPRIWASRKLGYLLDEVRLHQNKEVMDEIVRLSKEYGIITPYTSYLADERQDVVNQVRRLSDTTLRYDTRLYLEQEAVTKAKTDLFALSEPSRGASGQAETNRSINLKELQKAGRAPAGAQGLGGGGFGGGRLGDGLERQNRKDMGLDFGKTALAGKPGETDLGYKQVSKLARVQTVDTRVFYRRGETWFDNAYKSGQTVVRIKALSDAHFALLRSRPDLNRVAGVGDEVVISLGKEAVQIGKTGKETLSPAELRELTGK